jgi:cardiolipin synthase
MGVLDPLLRQLTLANQLTLLRLLAVPCVAFALLAGHPGIAAALYVAAAVTDALDGLAARRLRAQTTLGAVLDPAADKLLIAVVYVLLALGDQPRPFPEFELAYHMPALVALVVVARDAIISVVALVLSLPHGVPRIAPTWIGKITAAIQMLTGAVFLVNNTWPLLPAGALAACAWGTALLVAASGLHYLVLVRSHLQTEQ